MRFHANALNAMAATPSLAVARHLTKPKPEAAPAADGKAPAPAADAPAEDEVAASTNARHAAVQRPAVGDVMRLLRLAKPHGCTLSIAFVALCISSLINLGMPYVLGQLSIIDPDNILVTCAIVSAGCLSARVDRSLSLLRARCSLCSSAER